MTDKITTPVSINKVVLKINDIIDSIPTSTTQLTNDSGYITGISSSDVITALGYTPYNSTNPSGYQANILETVKVNGTVLTPTNKTVDVTVPTNTTQLVNGSGYITGITSAMVTNALGYTPYNSTNPSGYQANILETVKVNGSALSPTNKTVDIIVPTSTTQLTNDSGYITGISSLDVTTALGYNPESTSNLVTIITSTSTDSTYPSAKAVYSVVSANTSAIAINTSNIASNTSTLASHTSTLAEHTSAIAENTSSISSNTSSIATNTSAIADITTLIPVAASSTNQLTDTNFVNSSIATNTAYFIGTFSSVAELEAYSGTLTNNDYAFVTSTDTAGNTVYNRYKYNGSTQTWVFEYALNNSSFTSDQWAAINSGITSDSKVTRSGTVAVGSTVHPVYVNSGGVIAETTYSLAKSVPSDAKFTDTTYTQGTGISINGTVINHSNSVTASTAGTSTATSGSTLAVPYVSYDAQGHIIASGTHTHTITGFLTTISSSDVTSALGYTPYNSTNPSGYQANILETVKVNGTALTPTTKTVSITVPTSTTQLTNDSGYITSISSSDVTTALGFTPYNSTNPDGFLTTVTSSDVTMALGYTPYNSTNPSGYQANILETVKVNGTVLTPSSKTIDIIVPTSTTQLTNDSGYLTTITSVMITDSLTYTPYNSTNPSGYQANVLETVKVNGTALTPTTKTVDIIVPTSTTQLVNDSGYLTTITSAMVTDSLGYTPYNSTNPSGYQANVLETVKVNGTALTPSSKAIDIIVPTSTTQLTNDSGFITSSALVGIQTLQDIQDNGATGSLNLTDSISLYKVAPSATTTIIFGGTASASATKAYTFELLLDMSTIQTISWSAPVTDTLIWQDGVTPDLSEIGTYFFAFRKIGTTWYGNLQGKW